MKVQLLIPAAGSGVRLGLDVPKALADVGGRPLLARTLCRFVSVTSIDSTVITVPLGDPGLFERAVIGADVGRKFTFVPGGAERQDSVWSGLEALDPDTEIVVVHDAARPFVSVSSIQASIAAAAQFGAATVAVPSVDTILQGDEEAFLVSTPERRLLWACQTPQTFRVEVIREAHRQAQSEGFLGTDDASLVRRMGGRVKLVAGTPSNFKVTTPWDLEMARWIVREGMV